MPENEGAIGIFEPCRFADGFLVVCDPLLPEAVRFDRATIQEGSWSDSFRGNRELIQRSHSALGAFVEDKGWRMYGYQRDIATGLAAGLQRLGAEVGLNLEPIVEA